MFFVAGGTYAAYRANRGTYGIDFVARYFALNWVLMIRLLVLVFMPTMALIFVAIIPFAVVAEAEQNTAPEWFGVAASTGFEAVYYWRLVHHFREISSPAAA